MEEQLADESVEGISAPAFHEREMDKLIRQIIDRVRYNYLQNGESGRGIPSEVKRIIDANVERL